MPGNIGMRFVLPLAVLAVLSFGQTYYTDISGTWVGKRTGPNGEVEFVYDLKMSNGKITGSSGFLLPIPPLLTVASPVPPISN